MTLKFTSSSGRAVVDVEAYAQKIAGLVPGLILRRVSAGKDIHDEAFAGYSGSYMRSLVRGGESTVVDLRLTGGLANSVKLREIRHGADGVELVFGPDTGTSPGVSLAEGRAKRTPRRGPPHNVVGYWLHHGTPRMRARPWLGLSPADLLSLRRTLARAR